jgi:hypothetical protein
MVVHKTAKSQMCQQPISIFSITYIHPHLLSSQSSSQMQCMFTNIFCSGSILLLFNQLITSLWNYILTLHFYKPIHLVFIARMPLNCKTESNTGKEMTQTSVTKSGS